MTEETPNTFGSTDPSTEERKPRRRRGNSSKKRKKSSSDRQFLLVVGLVVFGGGFLVARFVLEFPIWQSLLVAPIAFLALILALVTWSWFTPAGRR